MTLGRPCPVVPLGAGERSSVGGAAAGGRSPPARCRALPGSGLVFRAGAFGPGPKNAAAPPGLPGGLPGPRSFRTLRVQPPPPPSGRVSSNAKKAREKPGPTIYGAWPMKRCQEGARQRPHPSGKAAAHALRAAAASSVPPRATTASRQQPLLRDYRRARSTAVGVASPWA